ncbi:hypothetical protein BDQ17DRAFT_1404038 [Cyathus striatus]|nr:hypothetical protein BDQ17DRAFT_1404038 [Cyathus striatus]
MIFRSEFAAGQKIGRNIEHDHRHISRIVGHIWNQMSESEKDVWRRKAEDEKLEHLQRYPGYRFCPSTRSKPPTRRNVKRNGAEELLRCQRVAELLMSGKQGEELVSAVKSISPIASPSVLMGHERLPTAATKREANQSETSRSSLGINKLIPTAISSQCEAECPVFLSPLLPPASNPEHLLSLHNYPFNSAYCGLDLHSDRVQADANSGNNALNSREIAHSSFFSSSGTYVPKDNHCMNSLIPPMQSEPFFYDLGPTTSLPKGDSPYPSSIETHYYPHSMPYSQHDLYPSLN